MQQFKAQQAKSAAQHFADSLNSAIVTQQKIAEIRNSAHFATPGLFFTSEDHNHVQLPTKNFRDLVQQAEEGTKAAVLIKSLRDDLQKLQAENLCPNSDFQYLRQQFNKLEESTATYVEIPAVMAQDSWF